MAQSNKGGKRPNSGRKKGVPNKVTQQVLDKILKSGDITPLEYLLKVMRSPEPVQREGESAKVYAMRYRTWTEQSFEAAKAAAPYVHPRLATIENVGKDGGPMQHKIIVELV